MHGEAEARAPVVVLGSTSAVEEADSQIDHLREELDLATLLGDHNTAHLDSEMARARRETEMVQTLLQSS